MAAAARLKLADPLLALHQLDSLFFDFLLVGSQLTTVLLAQSGSCILAKQRFLQAIALLLQPLFAPPLLPARFFKIRPRAVEVPFQSVDLGLLGLIGLAVNHHGIGHLRGLAIPGQGRLGILIDTQSFLVEKTQVNLGTGMTLLRRLAVPDGGQCIVWLSCDTAVVDLADLVLGVRITLLGQRLPNRQRAAVAGAVVGDVLTAADLTIVCRGLDGPPCGDIAETRA